MSIATIFTFFIFFFPSDQEPIAGTLQMKETSEGVFADPTTFTFDEKTIVILSDEARWEEVVCEFEDMTYRFEIQTCQNGVAVWWTFYLNGEILEKAVMLSEVDGREYEITWFSPVKIKRI